MSRTASASDDSSFHLPLPSRGGPLARVVACLAAIVTALAFGAALAQPAQAAQPAQPEELAQPEQSAQPARPAPPEPTAEDLSAFFDGVLPVQLEAHHVAGAVVTVVRGGDVVFARGYGHADLETRAPVDPDTTLFRIGSVTKLFTYTAAMQLVERGQLRLEEDVNAYLPEPLVPDAYGEPVTVAHLMTHTAGFSDRLDGLFARDAETMAPLRELLADQLPPRVRAPGQLAAYSNHGVALLGLIVEEVSGQSWESYVEDHVLAPLGMSYTTPRQPLPEELAPHTSNGYAYAGGALTLRPYTYVPLAPAGAMAASGADMGRFLIAHLQDGRFGDARILEEATAVRMKSRLFGHDPRLPGMAHGFYESRIGGEPVLGHDGGMPNFVTRLMLFPARDVGMFVSYNAAGGAIAQEALARAFVGRYFPHDPAPQSAYQPAEAERAEIAGSYRSTRSVARGGDKLANLVMSATLTPSDDGDLRMTSMVQPPMTLTAVEPGAWRAEETGQLVVSDVRDGRSTLFVENAPVLAFERMPWHATPGFHGAVFLVALVLLASAVVAAPFGWVLHRRLGDRPSALERWARAVLFAAAAMLILFVAVFASTVAGPEAVTFGPPAFVVALGGLLPLAALLAFAAAILAPIAWRRKLWSVAGRVHYTLAAAAGVALVWQFAYWDLLTLPGFGAA